MLLCGVAVSLELGSDGAACGSVKDGELPAVPAVLATNGESDGSPASDTDRDTPVSIESTGVGSNRAVLSSASSSAVSSCTGNLLYALSAARVAKNWTCSLRAGLSG